MLDGTFKRFPAASDVDRNGRIKFGTESNGGFKNITISNCIFDGCFGLTILSVDGAVIEDVSISNLTMRDVVGSPIFLRLGSRMRGPAGVPMGSIKRVIISNIVSSNGSSKFCSMITGVPGHYIQDVKISNILIEHPGGGTQQQAGIQLEEKEKEYPEPTMFGATPAHGFFIRHAKGVEISDFKIRLKETDVRPSFILQDVEQADFSNIKSPKEPDVPEFVLNDVRAFTIVRSKPVPDTEISDTKHQNL
jgi:polygalacturonase